MPISYPSASEFFGAKKSVPSEFRLREWRESGIAAQVRERAFFMASVHQANILQEFRDKIAQVLRGQASAGQAREAMRRFLEEIGYKALPGLEGTIKDLSTHRRRKVSIDANVALARGWQHRQERLHDKFNPGWELYRQARAEEPRDWQTRWQEAAAAVGWEGVSRGGEMIALVSSPIWKRLSTFRQPHPPFDYGSHMWTRPVDFDRCVELGLLTDEDFGHTAGEGESLNANTEVSAEKWDKYVRQQLESSLGNLGIWDGKVLRMADVNGTRPCTAEQLARLFSEPAPDGVPSLQRDAIREWIRDSSQFHELTEYEKSKGRVYTKAGLNEREDLARAFSRIIPTPKQELQRGLHFDSEEELVRFDSGLRERGDVYSPRPGRIGESWTDSPRAAAEYADKKDYQAIINCKSCSSARDLRPLYQAVVTHQQNIGKPIHLEAEFVVLGGTRFEVVNRHERRENGKVIYEYEVVELDAK